jgi:hypothetical protein
MTPFQQTILMCLLDHFETAYVINPWVEGSSDGLNPDLATLMAARMLT